MRELGTLRIDVKTVRLAISRISNAQRKTIGQQHAVNRSIKNTSVGLLSSHVRKGFYMKKDHQLREIVTQKYDFKCYLKNNKII